MVVVIGATGFIGMYTVKELLRRGKKVVATGRNENLGAVLHAMGAEFVSLDITNEADFKKLPENDVEGVILLAGLLPANVSTNIDQNENTADYFTVNVNGTIHVLEYCRRYGIHKVISCSSYADVSGAWKRDYKITEEEPRNFSFVGDHAVYVISKNAANDVIEYYNQQHGMQCAAFRLPPVYGVGPHSSIYVNGKKYKSGIQTFIENAEQGKSIELWGDAHISRDLIYVKDVASAFAMALESDKTCGLYNMTAGVGVDLEQQAKCVIDVFGTAGNNSKIIYCPDKKNNTPSFLFDMSKAKKDFGFEPQFSDFHEMMVDYKKELQSGEWEILVNERKKEE